jgi:hypothetical protein
MAVGHTSPHIQCATGLFLRGLKRRKTRVQKWAKLRIHGAKPPFDQCLDRAHRHAVIFHMILTTITAHKPMFVLSCVSLTKIHADLSGRAVHGVGLSSAAVRLLRLLVRIPPGAWISVARWRGGGGGLMRKKQTKQNKQLAGT